MASTRRMKTHTAYDFATLLELQQVVGTAVIPQDTLRRKAGSLAWGVGFTGGGVFVLVRGYPPVLAAALIVMGGWMLAQYFLYYRMQAWASQRRMRGKLTRGEYEFHNDHILARQDGEHKKYHYSDCACLMETEGKLYFFTEQGQGMVLDKGNLTGGTSRELRALLESKTGKTAQAVKLK